MANRSPGRRAALWASVTLASLPLLGAAATQFVAYQLDYHPALGLPLVGHVYAPWAVLDWMQAPWASQIPRTWLYLKAASVAGMGIAAMAIVIVHRGSQKPIRHEGVHGTARFATETDLADTGLFPPNQDVEWPGVYVGAWPAKDGTLEYLRHYGSEHVLCLGPLRSGKAVACAIPTLTAWPHSTVVYDEKGELWEYTSGWRKRRAMNTVLRWEPKSSGDSVAWNPLEEVRLGTEMEYGDATNIVDVLADPDGKGLDRHFDPVGAAFLSGLVLHVMYERAALGQRATLADVEGALADPARSPELLYRAMVGNSHARGQQHVQVARGGQEMLNKEVRERTGVHSTAARFVRVFRDPVVARNTSHSDFHIADLMNADRPVSLFLVTRGQDKMVMRPLLRLFLTMAMDRLCSADMLIVDGQQQSPHRHRLLMLIDEFASLGRMDRFQDAMAKCAGYGIKVFILAQDREQIIDAYGPHESVTSHCHVKVLFAPTNYATALWASDLLGRSTVVVEDVTESGQRGSGGRRGFSRTYRSVQRPLMTPDEVMRLPLPSKGADGKSIVEPGAVLIHVGGRYPILGVQSLFFRDQAFLRRVKFGRVDSDTLRL